MHYLSLPRMDEPSDVDPAVIQFERWLASFVDVQPDLISRMMAKIDPIPAAFPKEWAASWASYHLMRARWEHWFEELQLATWPN